jgi:hypothetical protein
VRHCYICDAEISGTGFRRTVRTGTSNRIYFGKRVSTSRGERRGLRTVCGTCAGRIDAQAKFKAVLVGLVVLGFIGFLSFGGGKNDSSPRNSYQANSATPPDQASVATYRATTEEVHSSTSAPPSAPLGAVASSADAAAPPATGGRRSQMSNDTTTPVLGGSIEPSTSIAPALHPAWRHVTSSGVQWSLRQLPEGMHLFIDLGYGQVATVDVPAEFLKLDLNSMNTRVDWMKNIISQEWPQQSALYVYRNGNVALGRQ